MKSIHLYEQKHPNPTAKRDYEGLIGVDQQKADLIEALLRVFDPERLKKWELRHHKKGLPLVKRVADRPPLIILTGEVGCGKTALARSVGSVLAEELDHRVLALETPSDIRGGGFVGQLSERVTSAFNEARTIAAKDPSILIIDEGDDLGTSRAQMQAHHEDRAGLNVLIKEIGRLAQDKAKIAVLLITNRESSLDPALLRRGHIVRFRRPDSHARRLLFRHLLEGVVHNEHELDALVHASERIPLFSYSDIAERVAEAALNDAIRENRPLTVADIRAKLDTVTPTPPLDDPSDR